jgi:cytoskeletal protein CcmA (bactofilin family)
MARDFTARETGGSKSTSRNAASSALAASEPNVLGQGMRVRGRLSGTGDLRVDGEIEGDVRVGGSLELGQTGVISGNVAARAVTIDGALTGDVEAEGAVHIRAGARVSGNMNGAEVALEEGAAFTGRIEAAFELPDGLGGVVAPAGRRGANARR